MSSGLRRQRERRAASIRRNNRRLRVGIGSAQLGRTADQPMNGKVCEETSQSNLA
ncbi:unnamed protein product, partial [Nesidiocoris tenuis]